MQGMPGEGHVETVFFERAMCACILREGKSDCILGRVEGHVWQHALSQATLLREGHVCLFALMPALELETSIWPGCMGHV